jgi:fused signal recognition particle receptor
MFGFSKRKQPSEGEDPPETEDVASGPQPRQTGETDGRTANKRGLLARLRAGLSKTGQVLTTDIGELLSRKIDDELLEELETRLLVADVGVEATRTIIDELTARLARKELADGDALLRALHEDMAGLLAPCSKPLVVDSTKRPFVILVVGINGAGKTTTIGKLAKRLQAQGRSVMLAAGDTFRAAAVEQLQVWGERNEIPVVAQASGADSASVIYDALQSAQARSVDVLIADTAGRLHTQTNLMEELKKVKRVIGKADEGEPKEVWLVLDAVTGQNGLQQARRFHEAVGLTGVVVTKLDGTGKGGILLPIARELDLPIKFIGVGEAAEDLQPYDAAAFVRALLDIPAADAA